MPGGRTLSCVLIGARSLLKTTRLAPALRMAGTRLLSAAECREIVILGGDYPEDVVARAREAMIRAAEDEATFSGFLAPVMVTQSDGTVVCIRHGAVLQALKDVPSFNKEIAVIFEEHGDRCDLELGISRLATDGELGDRPLCMADKLLVMYRQVVDYRERKKRQRNDDIEVPQYNVNCGLKKLKIILNKIMLNDKGQPKTCIKHCVNNECGPVRWMVFDQDTLTFVQWLAKATIEVRSFCILKNWPSPSCVRISLPCAPFLRSFLRPLCCR